MSVPVVIGLSAVIMALREGEACVLTVRPRDSRTDQTSTLEGLPFGPFDPWANAPSTWRCAIT